MANLWESIDSDSGNTTADSPTDTLTIAGGKGIKTSIAASSDVVTVDISPTISDQINTPFTLLTEHDGLTFTNKSATQMVVFQLSAATAGYSCAFARVAGQTIRVTPFGTDTIGPGASGKYLEMQANNTKVALRCYENDSWVIESETGINIFEA